MTNVEELRSIAQSLAIIAECCLQDQVRKSEPAWKRFLTWLFGWEQV